MIIYINKMFIDTMPFREIFFKSFVKSIGSTSGVLLTIFLGWQGCRISRKCLSCNNKGIEESVVEVNEVDSVVKEEIKNFKVLFDKL
jgi:hypothetical protein